MPNTLFHLRPALLQTLSLDARLTAPAKSCCPCSPSHRYGSVPAILQPGSGCQVPQLSLLGPHQALVFLPALLVHSESSLEQNHEQQQWLSPPLKYSGKCLAYLEYLHLFSAAYVPELFASSTMNLGGCQQWASAPFHLIRPAGCPMVLQCPCPDNIRFPLQLNSSLPHVFDGSNFCQRAALYSPSHLQCWKAHQLVGNCWGAAVDVHT